MELTAKEQAAIEAERNRKAIKEELNAIPLVKRDSAVFSKTQEEKELLKTLKKQHKNQ